MHNIDIFFIDVIIPLSLERNFTYAITKAEADFIKKGLELPFLLEKIKSTQGLFMTYITTHLRHMMQSQFTVF